MIRIANSEFYDACIRGVVTVAYDNCGERREKSITLNPRFETDKISILENKEFNNWCGIVAVWEENRIRSGESKCKIAYDWYAGE